MAPSPHYSSSSSSSSSNNNNNKKGYGYGYGNHYTPRRQRSDHDSSFFDDCLAFLSSSTRALWRFWTGRGRHMMLAAGMDSLRQLRYNLTWRRLLSFPHVLVAVWVVVLLWGERWVYHAKVEDCHWSSWEKWPPGATPHRLVLVADPQLIDPHSYPGRPWPINPLTNMVTDNYLRRSYNQLQAQLRPDTVFFLGDLFDGGREWKTAHGGFQDAAWAKEHPKGEREYVKQWNRRYGEDYWLQEYARFGDIFLEPWVAAGDAAGPGQPGRKLIASLPGNHDLGFGAEVKVAVRNRFEAYFGDANRVDVVGNHTFVSVDTVSLSARSSRLAGQHDLSDIYMPVKNFLKTVQATKRRAVDRELRRQRGDDVVETAALQHHAIDEPAAGRSDSRPPPPPPSLDPGEGQAELPSILLTHVPLYRPPGTPCGPLREHWPPTQPPPGQEGPVVPDHRNAISVSGGYQYQNVLDEDDSVDLVRRVGQVVHAFSGDDHDYCELRHDDRQAGVPEITVKSISMAMGVPTPGFLMVSLYNPIDGQGRSLLGGGGGGEPTLQTHLCLLPRMGSVFGRYIWFGVFSVAVLAVRALLVPVLKLQPFALGSGGGGGRDEGRHAGSSSVLPVFKAKVEDYDEYAASGLVAGFSASRFTHGGHGNTRGRSGSTATSASASSGSGKKARQYKDKDVHHKPNGKWGWGGRGPLKIQIRSDEDDLYSGGKWRAASGRKRTPLQLVVAETWTTIWRVVWMVVLFWFWLARRG